MFSNKNGFCQEYESIMNINFWTQQLSQKWCLWDCCTWKLTISTKEATQLITDCNQIKAQENAYCFWTSNESNISTSTNQQSSQNLDCDSSSFYSQFWSNSVVETFRPSKRKTNLPDIDGNLIKMLILLNQGIDISFKHSSKSARGLHNGVSHRRSAYVGVLSNRGKWQVLLNEGSIKKYIGTYESEVEAAIVNDFYSIGINFLKAKTNFNYSSDLVMSMIESYFRDENCANYY